MTQFKLLNTSVCVLLPDCGTVHAVRQAPKMLGDLDLISTAQKDAPTMRRLSVELGHNSIAGGARDVPSLRRLSTSSVASTRSSTSQESSLSPTFSSSLPNSFYLDRVSSLLGRAASMPADRGASASQPSVLPTIPAGVPSPALPPGPAGGGLPGIPANKPLQMSSSAPVANPLSRSLIRSLSKGFDFR